MKTQESRIITISFSSSHITLELGRTSSSLPSYRWPPDRLKVLSKLTELVNGRAKAKPQYLDFKMKYCHYLLMLFRPNLFSTIYLINVNLLINHKVPHIGIWFWNNIGGPCPYGVYIQADETGEHVKKKKWLQTGICATKETVKGRENNRDVPALDTAVICQMIVPNFRQKGHWSSEIWRMQKNSHQKSSEGHEKKIPDTQRCFQCCWAWGQSRLFSDEGRISMSKDELCLTPVHIGSTPR